MGWIIALGSLALVWVAMSFLAVSRFQHPGLKSAFLEARELYDDDQADVAFFAAVVMLPAALFCTLAWLSGQPFRWGWRACMECPATLAQLGVPLMKRRLFATLLLLVIGNQSTTIWNKMSDWYSAPPAPPSSEAMKIIASLESAEGWSVAKKEGSDAPFVRKGVVRIYPGFHYADVFIGESACNKQYSNTDLHHINQAAESCLRKLASQAIDSVTQK